MIQHLEAILIIIGQLAVWAFYALFVMAGVVMAINFMLELLHKALNRITGGRNDLRQPPFVPGGIKARCPKG
jgi:hypothetical protein